MPPPEPQDLPAATPAADLAQALLAAAPTALLHVDATGLVQYANAAAHALCEATLAPGLPLAALCRDERDAEVLLGPQPVQRALARSGSAGRWLDAHSQPLPGGGWVLALQPASGPTAVAGDNSLAEAQSALALAVDLGNIAVWRHDLATQRMHYNAQAYRVLDIPPRPEGLSIDEVREFIHPDDLPRVLASAQRALQVPGPTDMEARYRRADGSWRQVMTRRVLQRDALGQPQAFIGVAMDVTAQHEEQRQAAETKRRFALATEAAGIGYWMAERNATPTWNAPMRAMFALPPGEPPLTLGAWLTRCVHPDDRAEVQQHFEAWLRSREPSHDLTLRALRPDGSVRHLATHTRIERETDPPVMFGIIIDLTERRSAEQALRAAEESVALAARGAGLGAWQLDLDTGEATWDSQMWRLRGRQPEARAMSEAERAECVHPDDRVWLYPKLNETFARGDAFENEFRVVWPDGQVRWLASRSVEISTGSSRRRIGLNWDITDKRNAEAARRDREIALGESRAKSRFLARMSHELRTPLNAVLGFAQLLLAEEAGPEAGHDARTQARRRRVEHIRSAGQHLLALINDVLDLSSLESGELRIALQPVALAPLVAQTLPMLGDLREQHGVQLHLGTLEGSVLADATRLRQALLNLLTNAIKYNRRGGSVRIEAVARGRLRVLRVKDTGRGLDAEQLRHLFEPFNRLGRRNEGPDAIEGSGIGLAIVKALLERMGGSVHVESEPGVGSTFELHLADGQWAPDQSPEEAELAPPPAPAAAPAAASARATLLYIEDNPVNALIIRELLQRRPDLHLHVAEDGARGLQQAAALVPDLVLLDMQLPDMDGFEVLRRLRAQAALAQVPVIALSANAMPEDIERALAAGMSDYWTKPLDFTAFLASLEALFGPPASAA
ncbi:hybrid sensor histidine kinase/response regulator [Rubrivivax rivuli]|uniref:histidine kinase n=1 Tax=Rubrivivax rivuli TaxID=1862385 RepID=A0A437RIF8_9BURK|nr:hybrid sensor histidine kinase/response regulator [Rubrivivax rivuli]RVU46495.1 response regulator [Rubrivivax rivuli]